MRPIRLFQLRPESGKYAWSEVFVISIEDFKRMQTNVPVFRDAGNFYRRYDPKREIDLQTSDGFYQDGKFQTVNFQHHHLIIVPATNTRNGITTTVKDLQAWASRHTNPNWTVIFQRTNVGVFASEFLLVEN